MTAVDSPPRRVLPVIVLAQFAGTSLWFAVNAVMPDLRRDWQLPASAVGHLTSAVQLGFIVGTLVFALLTIADRHSARLVFLLCALAGALCNAAGAGLHGQIDALLALRFATGFFLAGIYPVGMKIAASWYARGLGAALGLLVGALVLGTAAPHGLRALGAQWPWQTVMLAVSAFATAGGVLLWLLVPDSPHLPRAARIRPQALTVIWSNRAVRASAFGYFGHMWELYTFWVLVPAILATRLAASQVPAAAFAAIALGFVGCAGRWARGAALGQRACGGVAARRERTVLRARAAAADRAAAAVRALAGGLRGDRGRRFAAVLHADRAERAARRGGQRAHLGQLHRLRDLDRQHPALRRAGAVAATVGCVAVAGDRARARAADAAAAARPHRARLAGASGRGEQRGQAPLKMKRVPVDDRTNFSGISACTTEMNVSPEQCIGIRNSGLIAFSSIAVCFW
jgi:MFS family permease